MSTSDLCRTLVDILRNTQSKHIMQFLRNPIQFLIMIQEYVLILFQTLLSLPDQI